jgi:6-pyruvoyltetrahydropterin/6-carboxytetrahydropterin synthase
MDIENQVVGVNPSAIITKEFHFEAGHHLPNHKGPDGEPGKCSRPHGHSYVLIVALKGALVKSQGCSDEGFVMDYYHLGRLVNEQIVDKWDHQYLNEILPFRTTAENMAHYIFGVIRENIVPTIHIEVTVKETAKTSARVTEVDFDWRYFQALRNGERKCE